LTSKFQCGSKQENQEGLELLKTAIAKAGYTDKVVIGMDVAASEFYNEKDKLYDLNFKCNPRREYGL
jgi:enolase